MIIALIISPTTHHGGGYDCITSCKKMVPYHVETLRLMSSDIDKPNVSDFLCYGNIFECSFRLWARSLFGHWCWFWYWCWFWDCINLTCLSFELIFKLLSVYIRFNPKKQNSYKTTCLNDNLSLKHVCSFVASFIAISSRTIAVVCLCCACQKKMKIRKHWQW